MNFFEHKKKRKSGHKTSLLIEKKSIMPWIPFNDVKCTVLLVYEANIQRFWEV